MDTLLIIVFIVAGMWWFGRYMEEGFNQMCEDLNRAWEKQQKRNQAIEKLDDYLDTH